MARARAEAAAEEGLYDRDFNLWIEEQVALMRAGRFDELDVANLLDEIESMARSDKSAITSNLIVVIKHLLKYQFQPRRRSRSWLSSIAEHRRRLDQDLKASPSLRRYAHAEFAECYRHATRQALIETGLAARSLPEEPTYTLEQALDPDFLPG